jgi:hypothetical protein
LKKLPIFIGIFTVFLTTSCTTTNSSTRTTFAVIEKNGAGEGGNPEVLNHCFGLKKVAKTLCFDGFFPDKSNLLIHPNHGDPIMLAGRGSHIEQRTLKLNNDDIVLLYLDISNVKIPLNSNIKATSFTYDKNSVVVNIDAKKIKEEIILKDKEGNVVLLYHVER